MGLVSDIYGAEGSIALGLSPTLTAANFGKVGTEALSNWKRPSKNDMSFACLAMVIQVSCILAASFSSTLNISTIFFVGGFLQKNIIAQQMISFSMQSLTNRAYFVKHSDFLGSLGSLKITLDEQETEEETH